MFYVTIVRGKRVAVLSGPYETLDDATRVIEIARQKALETDPWYWFDSFGVTKYENEKNSAFGVLTSGRNSVD